MDGLKLDYLENIKSILLVSFGGILGSNVRFFLFQSLNKFFINKKLEIIFINNLASFFLGFFSALLTNDNFLEYSYQIGLLIVIGFLGALSTFSTFIYDLFELACNFKFSKMMKMLIISMAFGLLSVSVGFLLGQL